MQLARAICTDPARGAIRSPGELEHTGVLLAQLLIVIVSALQCSSVNPAAFLSCSFQSFVEVVFWGFSIFAVFFLRCIHGCTADTTVNAPKNEC